MSHAGPPLITVEWVEPATFRDAEKGELSTLPGRTFRQFSGDSHADPFKAATRWATVMARRHGSAWFAVTTPDGSTEEYPFRPRVVREGGGV